MAKDPILFSLANPNPEIDQEVARRHGGVVATGRSDRPNQINNALAFPGTFLGALEEQAAAITPEMKLAASDAIASLVDKPTADNIVPPPWTDASPGPSPMRWRRRGGGSPRQRCYARKAWPIPRPENH